MKSTQWLDIYNILLFGQDWASVSTAFLHLLKRAAEIWGAGRLWSSWTAVLKPGTWRGEQGEDCEENKRNGDCKAIQRAGVRVGQLWVYKEPSEGRVGAGIRNLCCSRR